MKRFSLAMLAAALVASGCSKANPDCRGTATVCADSCVQLASDNLNCGSCGNACDAGKVCSQGECKVSCAGGFVNCGGSCIDPLTSTAYCGASEACTGGTAGMACPAGQQCGGGSCSCPTATPNPCGSGATAFCTDFQTDPENCGDCGTTCVAGQVCSAGTCVQTCSGPQATTCPLVNPTYCADTQVDANNCGSCGNVCLAGQQCVNGTCTCPETTPDACTTGGGAAFCTNVALDPQNCGTCGTTCASGTACSNGDCVTSCPVGEYACAGKCIDPESDPNYCGAAPDCTGGAGCGPNQACKLGQCADLACRWQMVASFDLTSLPAEATTANGGVGGQGAQAIYGRTAWYQTSDWNFLSFPTHLAAGDDDFAVQADLYLPSYTTFRRHASIVMFNDPTPGDGGGEHGVLVNFTAESGGGTTLNWWFYPTTWGTFDRMIPVTFATDAWHTVRVEGKRSACSFRVLVDGVLVDWYSKACDTTGATLVLGGNSAISQPVLTAWSNLKVETGPQCGF